MGAGGGGCIARRSSAAAPSTAAAARSGLPPHPAGNSGRPLADAPLAVEGAVAIDIEGPAASALCAALAISVTFQAILHDRQAGSVTMAGSRAQRTAGARPDSVRDTGGRNCRSGSTSSMRTAGQGAQGGTALACMYGSQARQSARILPNRFALQQTPCGSKGLPCGTTGGAARQALQLTAGAARQAGACARQQLLRWHTAWVDSWASMRSTGSLRGQEGSMRCGCGSAHGAAQQRQRHHMTARAARGAGCARARRT